MHIIEVITVRSTTINSNNAYGDTECMLFHYASLHISTILTIS